MLTICPRCNHPLGDKADCAACGYQPKAAAAAPTPSRPHAPPMAWQNTLLGRGFIGLVLAQGVAYGLGVLCNAVLSLVLDQAQKKQWWLGWTGLVVDSGLQGLSLLAGGALVGAGHQRGLIHGAILGLASSFVFLLIKQHNPNDILNAWALFGQPWFLFVVGAVGGFVGSSFWRPIKPLSDTPAPKIRTVVQSPQARRWAKPWLEGPTNWLRVMAGAGVAVGGAFWASLFFRFIIDSNDKLAPGSLYQYKFVVWEIAVFSLVVGGACSGANCTNGFKQGLFTALIAAMLLVVLDPRTDTSSTTRPTHALIFDLLYIRPGLPEWLENFLFTLLSVVPLTTLGGWFGSQLMPPVGKGRRTMMPY